jgi:hypothetical protein
VTAPTRRRLAVETVEFRPRRAETSRFGRSNYWLAGAIVLVLALLAMAWGSRIGLGTASGFLAVPVLMIVVLLPILRHEAGADRGFDAAGVVFLGFAVKMLSAFGRLFMVEEVYNGNGDSIAYDSWGALLARSYRALEFAVDPERPIPGTGFIRVLTGIIYAIIGADLFIGFLVYSTLAFIGTYLFYLAFLTAVPTGHHQRYALLVFLWPSLVFWPSSIGKEAWMILGLGLAAFGAARIIERQPGGYVVFAIGVGAMYLARPHIAILVVAAAGVGLVVSALFHSDDEVKSFGFMSKMFTILLLVVLGSLLAPTVSSFLNVDDVGGSGFGDALAQAQDRTGGDGDSAFGGVPISGPLDYPWAFVTVMFRPFPWEVNNFQSAISALEGVTLIALLVLSIRRLRRIPVEAIRRPYAAFAVAYVFMFCYVFAFIANFGILARQRSQLLPFVFVLVALPISEGARRRADSYRKQRADARAAAETVPDDEPAWALPHQGEMNIVTTPLPPPRKRS